MWPRFKTSVMKKDKKKTQESRKIGLTVNEEYLCAVRTKSYADFFLKVQLLVNSPPSSSPSYNNTSLSQVLLDPGQETITSLLESSRLFSNKSSDNLKSLLSNYFDISAEASSFCSHLLKSLNEVQADHSFILDNITYYSNEKLGFFELPLNPLSKQDFKKIHEKHVSILQHLKSSKKKVARKIKMIKCFNKASGVCVTAVCGLVSALAMFLAVHTLTALLMGPAILSLPMKPLKKKNRKIRFLKYGLLRKIGEHLDVATKGAYILSRDFDTMSRLVARLQDEIEHNKDMIRMCLERRENRVCLEVVKEIKKCEFGFRKQVEELEEHVYLCLVTINRARALVVDEISKNCLENLV